MTDYVVSVVIFPIGSYNPQINDIPLWIVGFLICLRYSKTNDIPYE